MLTAIRTLCVPKSVAFPSVCGSSVRDFALPRILGHFSGSTGELRVLVVFQRVLVVSVASAAVSVSLQVPGTSLYPSTCSRAIRLLSHPGHPSDPSSHWRSRSTHPLDPGLSTSPIRVFVLQMHTHGVSSAPGSSSSTVMDMSFSNSIWPSLDSTSACVDVVLGSNLWVPARLFSSRQHLHVRPYRPHAQQLRLMCSRCLLGLRLGRSHTLSTLLRADVILRIFVVLTSFVV